MRTAAIILNLCLIGFTIFLFLSEDLELTGLAILFFGLVLFAPFVSLIALFLQGPASKDWLSRYATRKAEEERRKLCRNSEETRVEKKRSVQ